MFSIKIADPNGKILLKNKKNKKHYVALFLSEQHFIEMFPFNNIFIRVSSIVYNLYLLFVFIVQTNIYFNSNHLYCIFVLLTPSVFLKFGAIIIDQLCVGSDVEAYCNSSFEHPCHFRSMSTSQDVVFAWSYPTHCITIRNKLK